MSPLKILSICLIMLALHGKAWAEIYETKDAEGNTEFTDAPPTENATVIDVQQPNIADAPAPEGEEAQQPAEGAPTQAPVVENNIEIQRDGYEEGEYPEGVYREGEYAEGVDERALRRDDAVDRNDPAARREVGDSAEQMPREVGDSEAQMPREVGDRPTGVHEEHRR